MTQSKLFFRKIVYIVLILILIIPISFIAQPESKAGEGQSGKTGGVIAQLRNNYGLSQSRLSDIDPTSESMKLVTMGLRGLAVNILWIRANEQKKKEEWDGFQATLNTLIKIQPNFVKVWEFQAHNLSYNISAEFDDYEYRYSWVRKGIEFLASGIPYNLKEHKILDGLGDFNGMKIGNADEKIFFRQMFREDTEYRERMAQYIEPRLYASPFGHDHWRMAYWWYDKSEKLVENVDVRKKTSDLVFYMKRPSQLRHQAIGMQAERRSDYQIVDIWREAEEEWNKYGDRRIMTSTGQEITLSGLSLAFNERTELRAKLDTFLPGFRDDALTGIYTKLNFSSDDIRLQKTPIEAVSEFEMPRFRDMNRAIEEQNSSIDQLIFNQLDPEQQLEARDIVKQINDRTAQLDMTERYQGTSNYLYWMDRNRSEQQEEGLAARQAWFDAEELKRKSIYDDETQTNYETGEKVVVRRGAISTYLDAFARYARLFEQYPALQNGDVGESIADSCEDFSEMLKIASQDWPDNFPLQAFVDRRWLNGERDSLPPSEEAIEQKKKLMEEVEKLRRESAPVANPLQPQLLDPSGRGN